MEEIILDDPSSAFPVSYQSTEDLLNEIDVRNRNYILRINAYALQLKKRSLVPRSEICYSLSPTSNNYHIPMQQNSSFPHSSASSISSVKPSSSPRSVISEMTPNTPVYKVQFKRAFRYYAAINPHGSMANPFAKTRYANFDFVVVECDRGEDLGMIVETIPYQTYVEIRKQELIFETDEEKVVNLGFIIRQATKADRDKLPIKFHDEQNVLEYCHTLLKTSFPLPIKIINVEFQFDRSKMSIYYTASNRVDFRDLVKTIFNRCKVRVWMIKVNRNDIFIPVKYAELALATGMAV